MWEGPTGGHIKQVCIQGTKEVCLIGDWCADSDTRNRLIWRSDVGLFSEVQLYLDILNEVVYTYHQYADEAWYRHNQILWCGCLTNQYTVKYEISKSQFDTPVLWFYCLTAEKLVQE